MLRSSRRRFAAARLTQLLVDVVLVSGPLSRPTNTMVSRANLCQSRRECGPTTDHIALRAQNTPSLGQQQTLPVACRQIKLITGRVWLLAAGCKAKTGQNSLDATKVLPRPAPSWARQWHVIGLRRASGRFIAIHLGQSDVCHAPLGPPPRDINRVFVCFLACSSDTPSSSLYQLNRRTEPICECDSL